MTKKDLLDGYVTYLTKNTSYTSRYIGDLKFSLENVPYDFLERILLNWTVRKSGVYEDSCNGSIYEECDKYTNLVCTYYHRKKHHRYYRVNHSSGRIKKSAGPAIDDYLDTVLSFLNNGELYYSLTIVNIITVLVERAVIHLNHMTVSTIKPTDPRYLRLSRTALLLFKEYLEMDKRFVQNAINPLATVSLYADITKDLFYRIDGAKALAREIGVDKFIQYAIDQCYFFEPDIVVGRAIKLAGDLTSGIVVDARSSENGAIQHPDPTGQMTFYDNSFTPPLSYPIDINNDNNSPVRDLIKNNNGYSVSEGAKSQFQNYRISHVWGRAFDPRFFTNLWNVVLVPAWANDLLDKPNPVEGSLESKLKSTIQRICEVLYFGGIKNWSSINIPQPSVINGGNDVVRPKSMANDVAPKINKENATKSKNAPKNPYLINIIKGKGSKTLGDIVKYPVYI